MVVPCALRASHSQPQQWGKHPTAFVQLLHGSPMSTFTLSAEGVNARGALRTARFYPTVEF